MGSGVKTAALVAIPLLFGACAPAAGGERAVTLSIEHSAFDPSRLQFKVGDTVRFVVNNTDPIDHELIIGNREVQAIHEKGTERHHGERPGEISVPAGTSAQTTYTFRRPGTLLFGCHLPDHYRFGMKGTISVLE